MAISKKGFMRVSVSALAVTTVGLGLMFSDVGSFLSNQFAGLGASNNPTSTQVTPKAQALKDWAQKAVSVVDSHIMPKRAVSKQSVVVDYFEELGLLYNHAAFTRWKTNVDSAYKDHGYNKWRKIHDVPQDQQVDIANKIFDATASFNNEIYTTAKEEKRTAELKATIKANIAADPNVRDYLAITKTLKEDYRDILRMPDTAPAPATQVQTQTPAAPAAQVQAQAPAAPAANAPTMPLPRPKPASTRTSAAFNQAGLSIMDSNGINAVRYGLNALVASTTDPQSINVLNTLNRDISASQGALKRFPDDRGIACMAFAQAQTAADTVLQNNANIPAVIKGRVMDVRADAQAHIAEIEAKFRAENPHTPRYCTYSGPTSYR